VHLWWLDLALHFDLQYGLWTIAWSDHINLASVEAIRISLIQSDVAQYVTEESINNGEGIMT
jgi:hypothetical protein